MARANTVTMIPLDRLAFHLGIDPFHFNGIVTELHPPNSACDDVWYQYDWQYGGKLSREMLAVALRQAEDLVSEHLNWTPIPCWFEEERRIPTYYKPEIYSSLNSRGGSKSIMAKFGHVLEVGMRASEYIDTPAVVLSDEDGDGYDETVTITFITTATEPSELHVYYPDRDGDDEWEIRPLDHIDIADDGTATIVFQRYLIPLDTLLALMPQPEDIYHIGIDGDDENNFLDAVDVYHVYTDTTTQATVYCEPGSGCGDTCEFDTQSGCLFVRDSRLGILAFSVAAYNEDTGTFTPQNLCGVPTKIKYYYRAGWTDPRQQYPYVNMDQTLERMICFYAISLLTDEQICGCSNTRRIWSQMIRDLAEDTGERRFIMPWSLMGNPLGTTFAAVSLWRHIQPLRLARGPSVMG